MIRPSQADDTDALVALAERTSVFRPMELVALREVLDDYYRSNRALGHCCVTALDQGNPIGFCYFAPAAMTEGTWYLYWIAVEPGLQSKGLGGALLARAEAGAAGAGGRQMLIETSSLAKYEPTRGFYRKHRYEEVARIPDYYAAGDAMVVYRKRLA